MSKRDLFVVVADLDTENVLATLLGKRQRSLGLQLEFDPSRPPQGDLLRYIGRDSGCYKDAVRLLRPPQRTHRRALLLFDHHGSGVENKSREEIENEVERSLQANGWVEDSAAVIVIDPELEAWVWASSPEVANVLGWQDDRRGLRPFLREHGLWEPNSPKPEAPKKAVELALRKKKKSKGARLFSNLASQVGLQGCQDRSFLKLQQTLVRWFPA